jgi:hypothetical protein
VGSEVPSTAQLWFLYGCVHLLAFLPLLSTAVTLQGPQLGATLLSHTTKGCNAPARYSDAFIYLMVPEMIIDEALWPVIGSLMSSTTPTKVVMDPYQSSPQAGIRQANQLVVTET